MAWGEMERMDLGFSLPKGVFKDLGNILAKWGSDFFQIAKELFVG